MSLAINTLSALKLIEEWIAFGKLTHEQSGTLEGNK